MCPQPFIVVSKNLENNMLIHGIYNFVTVRFVPRLLHYLNISIHILEHTVEKRFGHLSIVLWHLQRVHRGQMSYKCGQCPNEFTHTYDCT